MNLNKKYIWAFLLVFMLTASAFAALEEISDSTFETALDDPSFKKRISVDLKEINVSDVLKYLGDKAGVNIAISKNVGGRVSLSFDDVSIRDALEIALLSNDLAIERRGDILYVSLAEDYQNRYGELWGDAREVKIFKLSYAVPSEVLEVLSTLKSSIGALVVNDTTGTIVLMDTPDKVAQMQIAIGTMDQESLTQVIELRYAKAKDVEETLADRIDGKGIGSIKGDERSNSIIITTLPGNMDEVERIIEELDAKTRQVLIEAKIVKISLSPDYDMGIDWDFLAKKGRDAVTLDLDFDRANLVNQGKVTVGTLTDDEYTGTFQWLKTIGETKLLSSPRITAINNEEAKILIGTREAYVTKTITQGDTTTTSSENVTFLDVGVQLFVTPTINDLGFVSLKIKPEVSSVVRTLTTSEGNTIPIVDTTTAETTVMVRDGHTIIIGGLIKDETLKTTEKVPYLGDIPFFGTLFKSVDEDKEKTELVVFLTPRVLTGEEDFETWEKDKKPKGLRGYDGQESPVVDPMVGTTKFRGIR